MNIPGFLICFGFFCGIMGFVVPYLYHVWQNEHAEYFWWKLCSVMVLTFIWSYVAYGLYLSTYVLPQQ